MIRERLTPIWHAEDRAVSPALAPIGPMIALAGLCLAFGAVFVFLSLARHAAYQSHAFDLGNMDQAVWNTLHGHVLRFTDMQVGHRVLTSRLAIHVEPFLLLMAPLYALQAGPQTLLVAQALITATGAIPAYLLARSALRRPWLSLVFPASYLLHPSLQNAVLDDFHAVTLSAAFLMWAIYYLHRDSLLPFALFAALAVSTKEEVGLIVAVLGIWLMLRGRRAAGGVTALAGLAAFLLDVAIIVPHFNPAGHSPYLARYSYLGHGLGGVARGIVTHPITVVDTLRSEARLQYLIDLLHPLGFVPLLAVPALLPALPALLINMLSTDPTMYSGFYQYSPEVIPLVVGAAILGVAAVDRLAARDATPGQRFIVPALCGLVLLAALVDSRQYGFTPVAAGYLVPSPGTHQALEDRLLRLIPARAVVSASDEMEPHLSDRTWVYLLPTVQPSNGPRAQYIALDASIPSLPVTPLKLERVATQAQRSGYGVLAARDGILVLRRGLPETRLPPTFFSFAYRSPTHLRPIHARWGPLGLLGVVVHPRSGGVNRSRPAIGLETYWRASAVLPAGAHITFLLSPVYTGPHPPLSTSWSVDSDSPTWDWLPLAEWQPGTRIRADSLSLIPAPDSWGSVDVAVSVSGLGPVHGRGKLFANAVRVATISVRP